MSYIKMVVRRRRQRQVSGGGAAPVIDTLAYNAGTNEISLNTDTGSGTVYYELAPNSTPLTGAAIEASAMGSIAVASGVVTEVEDWTGEPDGTYWLNVVQKVAGVYSNVLNLEVTIAAGVFDPADLTNAVIVLDATDISTLWQNTDGTSAVTASTDLVGSATNRGTVGGLFTNGGTTQRPQYLESGALKFLDFDGSPEHLEIDRGATAFDLSGGYYLWFVMADDGAAAGGDRCFAGMAGNGTSSFGHVNGAQIQQTPTSGDTYAIRATFGVNTTSGFTTELTDSRTTTLPWSVVEFEFVPTAASPNGWMRIEQAADGGVPVDVASGSTVDGASAFPDTATGVTRLILGCRYSAASKVNHGVARIAAVVLVTGTLTTTERNNVRAWCRARAGF